MTELVIESKGFKYLSDVLSANNMIDLPENVMLNKVTTGCGMTSISLVSESPYVICVPKKAIIKSKKQWCEDRGIDLLCVYGVEDGGADNEAIAAFKGNKIIVTWDSLKRLVSVLGDKVATYRILIDECHQLIQAGNYRGDAIDSVINLYPLFKSFIFGTATPVQDRYQHSKLVNIPKVRIKWDNLEIVTINYCKYDENLYKSVAVQVMEHLNGNMKVNGHFFVNSVKSIATIIRNIKKGGVNMPFSIKIVCASTERNDYELVNALGAGYVIDNITSPVKLVNFYTSNSFEGCDIEDPTGIPYIISDGSKDHTKIDILVTLPQIIGRIRDSKNPNFVNLIYSPNKYYSHITEDDFEQYTKANLIEANKYVETINIVPEMAKQALIEQAKENIYLKVDGEVVTVNETALNSEMQNFATLHQTYYVPYTYDANKKKVYKERDFQESTVINNDITYNYSLSSKISIKGLNKAKLGAKANFSDLCLAYLNEDATDADRSKIESIQPIIKEACEILGADKMAALEYRRKDIEVALTLENRIKSNGWKIAKLLNFRVGEWIDLGNLKNKLQKIYDDLNLNRTAKAIDIKEYYTIQQSSKRINGVKLQGVVIVFSKF